MKRLLHVTALFLCIAMIISACSQKEPEVQKIDKVQDVLYEQYDVVVIGTDPEGITAAIAAARNGQKTLLIDTRDRVGGLFTLGGLNSLDLNYIPGTTDTFNKGIFAEFQEKIQKKSSFDIDEAERVFNQMIQAEKNIKLVLKATQITPIKKDKIITTITYINENQKQEIVSAKQFIDATQNADIAYKAGAQFTYGQEDYHGTLDAMCVTLIFELEGVKWDDLKKHAQEDGNDSTGADETSVWAYNEMGKYVPKKPNVRIRGLNIGRQNDGHILINALQILGADGTDPKQLEKARRDAEGELPGIIEFMHTLSGLEHVKLVKTMPELYVRETRHLNGYYRLTINDVMENKDFEDRIAFGSYPVDVQKSKWSGDIVIGDPSEYAIPFRTIVPKTIDNLLVASRSASYDSLAHGSARVVPTGMAVGEAAGVAAAYANEKNISFEQITQNTGLTYIKEIQNILNKQNAQLNPVPIYTNPVMKASSYPAIAYLRTYGIIVAGYQNNYKLKEKPTRKTFIHIIETINQIKSNKGEANGLTIPFESSLKQITVQDLKLFMSVNKNYIPPGFQLKADNETMYIFLYQVLKNK